MGIAGLNRGLTALGHHVVVRPLQRRTGFHTLDRWLYNAGVRLAPPRDVDLVVGVDLDGFLWARRRRVPFVASLKGIIADELRNERGWVRGLLTLQARWERLNTRRADLVMVTSRSARRWPGGRTASPPIASPWCPSRSTSRPGTPSSGARRGPHTAVPSCSPSRMYPRKHLQDLLHAAAVLRTGIPDVQIRIVGQGPEYPRLVRLHGELGLGESVILLGDVSRERLAAEYVGADVFCLPSVQEGFGIVFLEAMAAGLAVVACRAAAVPEVVRDGETGVLAPPRDPEALARALGSLLQDPGRAQALGEARPAQG